VLPFLEFGDKENEIATAKADAEWISMSIDEIHAEYSEKRRFLAALVKHDGAWQLVATQSAPSKPPQHG
jgi:hypothetical protein